MAMQEENAYILGTDDEELYRLGIQHQVWAEEAQYGWRLAGFKTGQTLLDLGCGPGFCTRELAFITGPSGKLIGVDKSAHYIQHLKKISRLYDLPIKAIASDFEDMSLVKNSLDGMYCRWALAWLDNAETILHKVIEALKPGATMVIHEYYNWATHQIEPEKPALSKAINAALQSFKDSEGEIDIGRKLPGILEQLGMQVSHMRPMAKIATPENAIWQWPKSFYQSYFPRLIPLHYLSEKEVSAALHDLELMEATTAASICCPLMVEIIARKP